MSERIFTFGDIRAFFHRNPKRNKENFELLYRHVREAFYTHTLRDEVEHEWLPYILRELDEHWDDANRVIYNVLDEDEEAPFQDRFFTESSPIYAMIRKLNLEDETRGGELGMLRALADAPSLDHITCCNYLCFEETLQPKVLEAILDRFMARDEPWYPRELGLIMDCLSDAHVDVLARHPILARLTTLELSSSCLLTSEGVLQLAKSPHLAQLKRFILAYSMESLHRPEVYTDGMSRRKDFLTPRDVLLLRENLPDLEMVMQIFPGPTLPQSERVKHDVHAASSTPQRSTLERLNRALEPLRKNSWPFDPEAQTSGGFHVELDIDQFDIEGDDWVPDSVEQEMKTFESWAYIYVLGTLNGQLERAFDAQGALLEPIVFRTHCMPDHQRTFVDTHPNYQGQYFFQTLFAEAGLVLIEQEETRHLILLPDLERPERNHLIDIFEALRHSEQIHGGVYAEYLCTFEDDIVGRVSGEELRGALAWKEEAHRLDLSGNLQEDGTPQHITFQGDLLPFSQELHGHGLELVTDAHDTWTAYIQRRVTTPSAARRSGHDLV